MHVEDIVIPNRWTKLSDYIEVDDGTFVIFNVAHDDDIFFIEGDEEPDADTIGIKVVPGGYVKYKKGVQENLYMRNGMLSVTGAPDQLSKVTINKVG